MCELEAVEFASAKGSLSLPSCVRHIDAAGAKGAKVFSTLDLRSSYLQIFLDEESMDKTQFITRKGTFRMRRMGFGLCNAPATYQRMMDFLLAPLPPDKIWAYLDDILIATETIEEHIEVLRMFLQRLRVLGLTLHPDKCKFLRALIKFLGFIINQFGRQADPSKVDAVTRFPQPRTPRQLRAFLGLCSYYRIFIQGFSKIARPMTELLKGDPKFIVWSPECQKAFLQLKQALTEAPALAYPDVTRPFTVEMDGSKVGIAAVLEQENRENGKLQPVAYASRTVRGPEVRYGATDLEMLAVVYGLKHFRVYIYGQHVTVITDHQALVAMLRKNEELASDRQMRWKAFIMGHDLEMVYRKGTQNAVCDALSRYFPCYADSEPLEDEKIDDILGESVLTLAGVSEVVSADSESLEPGGPGNPPLSDCLEKVKDLQKHDPEISEIIDFKRKVGVPEDKTRATWLANMDSRFDLIRGILYYVDNSDGGRFRMVVPARERDHLLWEHHCSPSGGHMGFRKVLERVGRDFYWPTLRQDVLHFCKSCIVCAARAGQGRHVKPPPTSHSTSGRALGSRSHGHRKLRARMCQHAR
ncbi:MAG: hypothetical protein GY696_02885 [Gammaproteobacteria bacterium]|nr:hypothetical protein [Gammaproteobacteria bacterium]